MGPFPTKGALCTYKTSALDILIELILYEAQLGVRIWRNTLHLINKSLSQIKCIVMILVTIIYYIFSPLQISTLRTQQSLAAGRFSETTWQLTSKKLYHMVGGFCFYSLWPRLYCHIFVRFQSETQKSRVENVWKVLPVPLVYIRSGQMWIKDKGLSDHGSHRCIYELLV